MLIENLSGGRSTSDLLQLTAAPDGSWTMPETVALFTAEFSRDGSDLLLQGLDGQVARLQGYFATQELSDILSHDGATLRAGAVERLAGPIFPAQYAQVGGTDLANAIGQVETLTGAAFVQRTDGQVVELILGEKVFQGDVVRTENGSTLSLTFADGTIFTLASGSRMVLDELIYDPQETDNSGVFDLIEGSFVFIAGQTAKTGGIEITTPAATMGIRGTTGKIDIQTINGIATVTVSLNPDPDGGLGAIELFDLTGQLIATITGTETRWIITPPFANQPPIEVSRDAPDIADDAPLLSQALAAFQSAVTRVQQGETFVELPEGDGTQGEDDTQPDPGVEEEEGTGEPLRPAPLDETGEGDGGEGEAGTGNPELDGTDEPILDEEPGSNEDDDASLAPAAPQGGTDFADAGGRTVFSDLAVQSVEDTSLTAQLPVNNRAGNPIQVSLTRGAENGLVVLASDGTFTYTPNPDFDGTDSFVVSGLDDDGVLQDAVVTVVVDPVNDAPTVNFRLVAASSVESGADTAPDSGAVSGTLTFVDVDQGAAPGTWSIEADAGNATAFGTISIDAATGNWRYELDQATTDTLTDGDVFEETFVATVTDAEGATDVSTLVITVTGTNDAPVISATDDQIRASMATGPRAAEVDDPGVVTTGTVAGTLTYTDVDEVGPSATWSIAAAAGNETGFGTISIDALTGRWSYTIASDTAVSLNNGETAVEVYTATVIDALGATASQDIEISIIGTNDAPVIQFSITDISATVVEDGFTTVAAGGGASSVTVDEDGLRMQGGPDQIQTQQRIAANTSDGSDATGTLRYVDADGTSGAATWSIAPENASLGEMTIDAETGQWHYFLDQEAANSLRAGDEVIETFLATVTDPFGGTASQVITITVQGANDAAEIQSNPQDLVGAVAEDGAASASGQLSFVDPDAEPGETATWSIAPDGASRGVMTIDAVTGQWLYALDTDAANSLSAAGPEIEIFTATVTDSFGATSDQSITITLTGQNDGPTIAAGSASLSKQAPSVTVDLTALGSDPDVGETGETLIYTITGAPSAGGATLSGGVLTFTTDATFADLGDGDSRDVEIGITVTDAFGATNVGTVTITVTGTETGPVITSGASAAQGSATEASGTITGGTAVRNTLTYTDDDATTPTSGVWTIAPAVSALGEMSINAVTGAWAYGLDNTRSNSLNEGEVVLERFTATITDEDGQTDSQEITITITGTNDAPVLSAGSETMSKDTASLTVDLTALGSDVDAEDTGALLTYALVSGPASGSATVNNGALVFSTDGAFDDLLAGDTRDAVIEVSATDAQGAVVTGNVTITVTGTGATPQITSELIDARGSVTETGAGVTGPLQTSGTLSYTDADAATATSGTWTIDGDAAVLGVMSIDAVTGVWTYTLNDAAAEALDEGDVLTEDFTATITDVDGLNDTQAITITITGTNDAPTFDTDTRSISKDTASVVFDLSALAADPDFDDTDATLGFSVTTPPSSGSVTLVGDQLTFSTDSDFADLGPGDSRGVTIGLSVTDPQGAVTPSTMSVTVTGNNAAPVITSSAAAANGAVTEEGVGVSGTVGADASGMLAYSDADERAAAPGTWTVAGNSVGSIGAMAIVAETGAWEYTINQIFANNLRQGEVVQQTFTATITDEFGATDTQEMVMTITGTNDRPVANLAGSDTSETAATGGPATLTGNLLFDDVDDVVVDAIWTIDFNSTVAPVYGSMSITDAGVWTYTVNAAAVDALPAGAMRTESFTATVTDEFGAIDTIGVEIQIDGTNDAPVITSLAAAAQGQITEDGDLTTTPATAIGGTLTYSDANEGAGPAATWSVSPSASALGTITIGANNGVWEYTLDQTAADALNATDAPVIEQFTATVLDADGGSATQTITVTIVGTNDAPVLTAGVLAATEDGGAVTLDLDTIGTDVDTDDVGNLTYRLIGAPAEASITNNILTYDPGAGFENLAAGATTDVALTVEVEDTEGATATNTVTVTVTGVNDAPTITSVNRTISEDTLLTDLDISTLGLDIDTGDELSYAVITTPIEGFTQFLTTTIRFQTDGDFDDLSLGDSEQVVIGYRAEDISGARSPEAFFTITIEGANDAPVMTDGAATIEERAGATAIGLAALASDADAAEDGTTLTYAVSSGPAKGIATINGLNVDFDPNGEFADLAVGETEDVTFEVTGEDAAGAVSNAATITVTITGQNNSPVAADIEIDSDGRPAGSSISWQASATDSDDAVLDLISVGTASNGTVSIEGNGTATLADDTILYTPNPGLVGTDSFTYTIADPAGNQDVGTVNVTFTNTAPVATDATASVTLESRAGASQLADNGHFYQFVRGIHTWDEANTLAQAQGGYLATITSLAESNLANALVGVGNSSVDAWLGGSDADNEATWLWVTGPESGQQFWSGNSDGGPFGGAFENWLDGQPNSGDAVDLDHLSLQRSGVWDDVRDVDGRGYLLEYDAIALVTGTVATINDDPDAGEILTYEFDAVPPAGFTGAADGSWSFDRTSGDYASLTASETQDVIVNYTVTDAAGAQDTGTLTITITGDNDAPTVVDDAVSFTLLETAGTRVGGGWTEWSVDDGGNGHSYQHVPGTVGFPTWADAAAASAALGGHLATITSQEENDFLTNTIAPNSVGFIAGSDSAVEGEWRWAAGPEAGQQFWQSGSGGGAVGGAYVNWDSFPSSETSDVLLFERDGTWSEIGAATRTSYYVEFSAGQFVSGSVATNDSDPEGGTITYTLNGTYAGLSMLADGTWSFDRTDAAYSDLAGGATQTINAYYNATDALGATSVGRLLLEVTGVNSAPDVTNDVENITLTVDPGPTGAGWSQFTTGLDANDHYYQYIVGSTNWSDARADAATRGGHLATITSQGENDFIDALRPGGPSSSGWLGAADGIQEGAWRWVDGPEALDVFWQGDSGGGTVGGSYANWAPGQPLFSTAAVEDVLFFDGDGQWNDLDEVTPVNGYYLEYSGLPLITGSIAANDSDADGDTITYTATNSLAGVTLDGAGNWTLDVNHAAYVSLGEGERDSLTLTYNADDGNGGSTPGTLTLNLTGVNDAPVFEALDAGTVAEGAALATIDLLEAVSDADTNDTLSVQNFAYAWSGSGPTPVVTLLGNNTVQVDPAVFTSLTAGQTALLSMTYDVSDGTVLVPRTATFEITGSGGPIQALSDNITPGTDADTTFTILTADLLANDLDPDGLGISVVSVSPYSAFGATAILSGTDIFYNPTTSDYLNDVLLSGQSNGDQLVYTIETPDGLQSSLNTFTFFVSGLPPSGDAAPTPGSTATNGFTSGASDAYTGNPLFLQDLDGTTGITYKFGLTTPDGLLPDFLSFDASTRVLSVDDLLFNGGTDAGYYDLILSGFEADGDNAHIPFGLSLNSAGDIAFVVFGGGTSGFEKTLEVGINPGQALGGLASPTLVDLTAIDSLVPGGLADVNQIDISNGQVNDLVIDSDDLLNLIEGNASGTNETITILADGGFFDGVGFETTTDWTVAISGGGATAEITGNAGLFSGLGLFATLELDGATFT